MTMRGGAILLLVMLLAPLVSTAGLAVDQPPSVHISQPWSRATTADASSGAVYVTLINPTASDERLLDASSPAASAVELHVHRVDEHGVMHMEQVTSLIIPAHGQLVLRPGGAHLMLLGLAHGLALGTRLTVILRLGSGSLSVEVPVRSAAAMSAEE